MELVYLPTFTINFNQGKYTSPMDGTVWVVSGVVSLQSDWFHPCAHGVPHKVLKLF